MPILTEDGKWTSPFELAYSQKLDWRNLIPMFSLGYIKCHHERPSHCITANSQTIKDICMGNDPLSNGLLFYISTIKKWYHLLTTTLMQQFPLVPSLDWLMIVALGLNS
eukprot:6129123-Ditylum_brightwellii.AAC.1